MANEARKKVEASSQAYLPISEIKEGTVLMKDGSLKAVVLVSSLNFALKGEEEKEAIILSYQSFLNSLSFPIQIVANSRKLDLSNYIAEVTKIAGSQTNPLLQLQTQEYVAFIKQLLETANIMEKRFFVVVPYYPSGLDTLPGTVLKKKTKTPTTSFEDNKKYLLSRVEEVVNGLSGIGLRCVVLGTQDLLELYYAAFNPDIAQNVKLETEKQDIGSAFISGGSQEGVA